MNPTPRTPQQNRIVERKNQLLQEMTGAMLNTHNLSHYLWAQAFNTACYITNHVFIRNTKKKTTCGELWHGGYSNIGYFKDFACKCFIVNNKECLHKIWLEISWRIFRGYSTTSKASRVYNKSSLVVEESMHVIFIDQMYLKNRKDFVQPLKEKFPQGKT